ALNNISIPSVILVCINSTDSTDRYSCIASRIIGIILLLVSIICAIIDIRFLYWSSNQKYLHCNYYPFIVAMFAGSLGITFIIIPPIIIQCLWCRRFCFPIYCKLEGFLIYFTGCAYMYMLFMLSIIRYTTVFHPKITKMLLHRRNFLAVLCCWVLALLFAIPPLFGINNFVAEGLGFHCGLEWNDASSSKLYLLFIFLFVYFIPLTLLLLMNVRLYRTICQLISTKLNIKKQWESIRLSSLTSSNRKQSYQTNKRIISNNEKHAYIRTHLLDRSTIMHNKHSPLKFVYYMHDGKDVRKYLNDKLLICHAQKLKRLKIDRRFAIATIFFVTQYVLCWAPYATVALFQIFGILLVKKYPIILAACALVAKLSIIANPIVYIFTIKWNGLMTTVFKRRYFF
ncbi:unnamed protein product, partial [Didymodactylos carnosus]